MTIETDFPYSQHTLNNGIKLVHRYTNSPVAHCGIMINAGTRDETKKENGIAHFIEHCIFKGTKHRKAFHILNRIDGVGGELNAYTTKEETCIYASFLNRYQERVLELFADIVFNSTFPEKEIEKEKVVVLDEINSYKDSPAEQIFDDFEQLIFDNHSLGSLILGKPKCVKSFHSDDIKTFIDKNYATNLMTIACVGAIDFDLWVRLCEKFFANVDKKISNRHRKPPKQYSPKTKVEQKDTYQAHAIMGSVAYDYNSKYKMTFSLLNNILGGGAMNSYLNMHIREKYGFTYSLESNYTPYSDTGVFTVYAGTNSKYIDKTLELIRKELEFLTAKPLSTKTILQYKQQLKGQLAIQYDSNQNEMLAMCKSVLNHNKIDTLRETYKQIDCITNEDLFQVAQDIFDPKRQSLICYLPK
ncbi:MAG: insulinase family protein [Bacteroidales bacterium]|jgi:predicted Zn-dependent peptidase|nr:insulinase family protein [Bacteroidales bacterium]